jgi:RNA polymerase sigma-70 factor (ECF subfamily)
MGIQIVMSDEELMTAFAGGDDGAYVELYQRHKHVVFGYCLRMLSDQEAAEEIIQSVFARFFERRHRLEKPRSFRAWILTVARNECINHFRITGRFEPLPGELISPAGDANPLAEVERTEESALLAAALSRLKPYYREVVVLRDYQGFSYPEISSIIGEPESVVKSRLFTARRQLHGLLKPYFLERD